MRNQNMQTQLTTIDGHSVRIIFASSDNTDAIQEVSDILLSSIKTLSYESENISEGGVTDELAM